MLGNYTLPQDVANFTSLHSTYYPLPNTIINLVDLVLNFATLVLVGFVDAGLNLKCFCP